MVDASLAYQPVVRIERDSWDPSGWEEVGKRLGSLENHIVQEGGPC
jgi:hypothetical protein